MKKYRISYLVALSRRKKSSWFTLLYGLPRSPHLRPPHCQDCQFAEGSVRGTFMPPYQIFGALAEVVFFREHESLRLSAVEPAAKVPRSLLEDDVFAFNG